eukprot:g13415.t1
MVKARALIEKLSKHLRNALSGTHPHEVYWMAEKLTGVPHETWQGPAGNTDFPSQTADTLTRWVLDDRIQKRKPVQYILGEQEFCGLSLLVEPPTLIPRPETEEMCDWLLSQLARAQPPQNPPRFLDLCSGSGNLALALAHRFPEAHVYGVDVRPAAVDLARRNQARLGIRNADFLVWDVLNGPAELSGQLERPGSCLGASLRALASHLDLRESVDLVVSNPPYVTAAEWREGLQPEVQWWEDEKALVAPDSVGTTSSVGITSPADGPRSSDGMLIYQHMVHALPFLLRPAASSPHAISTQAAKRRAMAVAPSFVCELGSCLQAELLLAELGRLPYFPYRTARIHTDFAGRCRWASAILYTN